MNEFRKYCKYYKGEEKNPYFYSGEIERKFWGLEQMFCEHKLYDRWEPELDAFIHDNPNVHNFLTSDAPKCVRVFVYFAEAMLEKWDPISTHLVIEYAENKK